jgi:hypothetical protein
MLNRLWKQERVWDVAKRFGTTRGWMQSFLQSTAGFASSIGRFCEVHSYHHCFLFIL